MLKWKEGSINSPSLPIERTTKLSLTMDPDLLEGNSCVLFQLLLDEALSVGHGRVASKQKTTLERIEKWSIPKARAEALSCSLLRTNLDIEVLKKAQALVPAHIGEAFDSDIVKWRAEADKWKMELLKGIVFKMLKDIVGLEEAAQEFMCEAGQKNVEMDTSRKKAQECGGETESRVASSVAAMTQQAKDDELRIESLQKQLAEKSKATEILETRVKATASRVACSLAAVTKRTIDDELRIESLQKQVAEKSKEIAILEARVKGTASRAGCSMAALTKRAKDVELRIESLQAQLAEESKAPEILETRVKAIASRVESSVTAVTRKAKDDEWNIELSLHQHAACERAEEEDILLLLGNEGFPAAKRTKWKGGAHDFTRVKVAGDEDEDVAAKQQSRENGMKDISILNDSGKHVKRGVGTNSDEEAVNGRFDQIPQQQVPSRTPSVPSPEQDSDLVHVPDADFYNYDVFRNENDIRPRQVWALYDDQDGMPRFYALISKVTTSPFRTHVNWLEHGPATEEDRMWTASTARLITCGDFKVGKALVVDQINSFSHFVMDKVGKGLLKIYPKKGQVWAVYKDPEQGIGPAGGPRFHGQRGTPKFEMVEILSEFCRKEGLRTGKLVKVTGFQTVFRRQDAKESFMSFKPKDLCKFSHSVPNQRIEDSHTDAHGIPRGSLELDPASTPDGLRGGGRASDPSR